MAAESTRKITRQQRVVTRVVTGKNIIYRVRDKNKGFITARGKQTPLAV